MKKVILLLAAISFSWALLAQSGKVGDLNWKLRFGTLTISGYGAMPDYDYFDRVPWGKTYHQSKKIKAVVIKPGVTSIGSYAFRDCDKLQSITIPESVTEIRNHGLYSACGLKSITIPNSVTKIGNNAFNHCFRLQSVTIPNSVTEIGEDIFYYCELQSIYVASNNPNYSDKDGILFNKKQTQIVSYPTGREGTYIIPNGVNSIGSTAFSGCFKLTSITIPSSVTEIGNDAFKWCKNLQSIYVASNNPYYSDKDGILFNKKQTQIVSYPAGRKGAYTIPDGVNSIGNYAFFSCRKLQSITIPNSVTEIGNYAFALCEVQSITIPNGVTEIGAHAFVSCDNLQSVTIPNGVTKIGEWAFARCLHLQSITIPNSATNIGKAAFLNCNNLQNIYINWKTPLDISGKEMFKYVPTSATLHVPAGTKSLYQQAEGWKKFKNIVEHTNPIEEPKKEEKIIPNPQKTDKPIAANTNVAQVITPQPEQKNTTTISRPDLKITSYDEVEKYSYKGTYSQKEVTIQYEAKTFDGSTPQIEIRIDGKSYNTAGTKGIQRGYGYLTIELPEVVGVRQIGLIAKDGRGFPSEYVHLNLEYKGRNRPVLHTLAVGVDKFQDTKIEPLQYAAKDANDFGKTIQQIKTENYSEKKTPIILTNENATQRRITAELSNLIKNVKQNDVVILFFSGHGVREYADTYFLANDVESTNLWGTAVNYDVIRKVMRTLEEDKQCNVIIFMDACYAGEMGSKSFEKEVYEVKAGIVEFYSSTKEQKSKEDPISKNGFFTRALIDGLNGAAKNSEGRIYTRDLGNYIFNTVKEKTKGEQSPSIINKKEEYFLF